MATAAALITAMTQRLQSRHRGLEAGAAAVVVYDVWTNLCTFTEAWRETASIDTVENTKDYTLVTPYDAGAYIYAIQYVRYPDTKVQLPTTQYEFFAPNRLEFRYVSSETKTNGLEASCVMLPVANSPDGVNVTLFSLWQNAIWAGCNANLHGETNRPWADPAQQARFAATFELLRAGIRGDAMRNGTRRSLQMWTPNVFA
jgi:hypothetical protein